MIPIKTLGASENRSELTVTVIGY